MADIYPQLPTTVWHGVRQILKRTPKRKLDESILAVELNVQQTAAKQYLRQFVILGLLNEDGGPTELADRWRQDDEEAVDQVLRNTYPQALLELAPRDNLDRSKIVKWFSGQGLGTGAAGNKASTYVMIAQPQSGAEEQNTSTTTAARRRASIPSASEPRAGSPRQSTSGKGRGGDTGTGEGNSTRQRRPDFNVNIQIHISADASTDQIEAIFSSMKRYFDDPD